MYSVCKYKEPIQWDTEDQYNGTKSTYKGPIVWAYGDTMHVQKNNPIGTRGTCVYKGPTLWGSDAQIEDQSYKHMMHVQSSNPMGYYVHVRAALCKVRRNIYMENPACTKRSCYKECFGNNAGEKLRKWYRSSVHKPTEKCTQLNGIDHVHVTKCGVRVCHHHQTGLFIQWCT